MHDHDQGLAHDLQVMTHLAARRRVLRWLGGATLLPLLGCGSENGADGGDDGSGGQTGTAGSNGLAGSDSTGCSAIPEETAGPFPGDGSNGANALAISGVVRSDIRSSIGDLTGTAEGIPLTVKLNVVNANGSCAALAGYAVYVWQCDRAGNYSMYSITDQNYLRGVQETDSDGTVTFTSIFPACYVGRWPHVHFEVYATLDAATSGGAKVATSQFALPEDVCDAVFATTGYEQSVTNLAQLSLTTDGVFSDGISSQLATVTGSLSEGYVASLTVPVSI